MILSFKRALAVLLLTGLSVFAISCESEGPAEKAGEKIDQAIEQTGDAIEETGDEIKEKTE